MKRVPSPGPVRVDNVGFAPVASVRAESVRDDGIPDIAVAARPLRERRRVVL